MQLSLKLESKELIPNSDTINNNSCPLHNNQKNQIFQMRVSITIKLRELVVELNIIGMLKQLKIVLSFKAVQVQIKEIQATQTHLNCPKNN